MKKELTIKARYIATHAQIIIEQTLVQCYSSRFEAIC